MFQEITIPMEVVSYMSRNARKGPLALQSTYVTKRRGSLTTQSPRDQSSAAQLFIFLFTVITLLDSIAVMLRCLFLRLQPFFGIRGVEHQHTESWMNW